MPFYIILPAITRNVSKRATRWKKTQTNKQTKNKKQCTKVRTTEKIKQEKTIKTGLLRVNFLFSSFCHSSSNSVMFGPSQYIHQAFLLHSFFKILIYIFCYPWSEVCMIVAFLPNSFAYFLRAQLFIRTPDNSNCFRFLYWEGSSYRESTVLHCPNI